MLDRMTAPDFAHAAGTTCKLITLDGAEVAVVVDTVSEKPQYANPYLKDRRTPFMVTLTSCEPTTFCDGPCDIVFGDGRRLEGIDVSRVAPLGRDPQLAYYQMVFN